MCFIFMWAAAAQLAAVPNGQLAVVLAGVTVAVVHEAAKVVRQVPVAAVVGAAVVAQHLL
jgi:hypothetical protein